MRGNPFDVCFDIDDCWFSGRKSLIQRTGKLTGFVDNDAKTSHRFSNLGKVGFGEKPKFIGAGCLSSIDSLDPALFLVQRVIVIDDNDRVDATS